MSENQLATVLFVLFFGLAISLFAGLSIWATSRIKRLDKVMTDMAQQHNWRYDKQRGKYGYRLQGQNKGIHWTVRAWVNKSKNDAQATSTTMWHTDDIQLPRLHMLVRTPAELASETSALGNAGMAAANALISLIGGSPGEHGELLKNGTRLQFKQPALQDRYVIVTNDPTLVGRIFDERVEGLLLHWQTSQNLSEQAKKTLHIDLGQTNLRIYVKEVLEDPQAIELLITLGTGMAYNYCQPMHFNAGHKMSNEN